MAAPLTEAAADAVITTAINAEGTPGTDLTLVYERGFGIRNQIEAAIQFSFAKQDASSWRGGVGGMVLGYRRLLLSSLRSGSILNLQGEAILPTGNRAKGFGKGALFFETFASYGQLIADKCNPAAVLHQIAIHVIRSITCDYLSAKSLHILFCYFLSK